MGERATVMVIMIILILTTTVFGQTIETERAEFSGIHFKTRYQTVKIDTPILVEMEKETRLLTVTLKNPETARFKFLMKITPRDFERWQKSAAEGAKNIFLLNNQRAYFVSGKEKVKIGEITINTEKFEWLEKYKGIIGKNFENCRVANSPQGYPDIVCSPLLIKAKVVRIERSDFNEQETILIQSEKRERLKTGSPILPEECEFPYVDYLDVYIEILSIKK